MRPVLIAMCGLPFSGKSVLARSLGQALGIRVLSYDFEIYQAFATWYRSAHQLPRSTTSSRTSPATGSRST